MTNQFNTPWETYPISEKRSHIMNGLRQIEIPMQPTSLAAHIVRCVNSHDALVNALRGLDEAYCRAGTQLSHAERKEDRMRLIAARAALTLAQGEQK